MVVFEHAKGRSFPDAGEVLAGGYRYAEHLKSDVHHARLVSDALLDAVGVAGTPADVLPKFRTLWRETVGLNVTFFLRPDGQGKQRSFELFVQEVWPALPR